MEVRFSLNMKIILLVLVLIGCVAGIIVVAAQYSADAGMIYLYLLVLIGLSSMAQMVKSK